MKQPASSSAMLHLKHIPGPRETLWMPLVSLWVEGTAAVLARLVFLLELSEQNVFCILANNEGDS